MDLKAQIEPIIGIVINPKRTLAKLPSDEFYIASLLISSLLLLSRFIPLKNPGNLPAAEVLSGVLPLILWFLTFFFVLSFVIKFVAKFFGRVITYKRAMNILGYCQIPRVLFVLPVSLIIFLIPSLREPSVLNQVFNIIAVITAIYSFALVLYGIKLSVNDKANENN